ncbi:GATOR complex protein NPRL3-like [Cimex lectularius]|uniref:GATOR complex protein NPRL3 n=1 Tax=Cimex lectularius TaxID=79782 RepID=A0A8I6SBC3_CIMLE|nr:GATOR complex protein NPRL3-like [Cimex lectularius]
MDADPLSVILVKRDSKGDRLLFRYPCEKVKGHENGQQSRRKNPYALTITEDIHGPPPQNNENGCLGNFPDEVLSNLFAVKQELCEAKFELKVNNVRFVGHPTLVQPCSRRGKPPNRPIILINVVFALQAAANHSIVKCYYELSKRLGAALRHEERRCGYVNSEIKSMISAHDDRPEDLGDDEDYSPFEIILERCSLAKDLMTIYNDLCNSGLVQIRVNRWIALSFCLPQKVHQLHNKALSVDPEAIDKCLQSVRPYHGLLLLVDATQLLDSLVPDASPALIRLIKIYTPLKSLQILSADADLTLAQVFNLAGHLVYWGKAIIIYPLCESNVYMTAPNAPVHASSPLVEKFSEQFPAQSLIQLYYFLGDV